MFNVKNKDCAVYFYLIFVSIHLMLSGIGIICYYLMVSLLIMFGTF